MEAVMTKAAAGTPPLSPVYIALLSALRPDTDERSVAREMSIGVPELRKMVKNLSRALTLPEQGTPEQEFSQLLREAERIEKKRAGSVENAKGALNGHAVLPQGGTLEWQKKLAVVAVAIAKGVLISVDPYKLRPMAGQPRDYFPEEEQDSLESSLGVVGQIQDLIIRKKPAPKGGAANVLPFEFDSEERVWRIADTEYEICDGERRWRGAMAKGLLEIRAKLIEIDDEGAYLVAAVSNFNRVGHTTLERARNIERLMKGNPPFPIEAVAMMQGISVATARKMLDTLKLPPDIHALMNPKTQKEKGEEVLGKVPSYHLARLAGNPVLHEHARHLANRYVRREIKQPELAAEVDRILSRSPDASRDVLAERQQPARRLTAAERRLTVALDAMRDVQGKLQDLDSGKVLPSNAKLLGPDLNSLIDMAEKSLRIIGVERKKK